jgi:hypothetical protein
VSENDLQTEAPAWLVEFVEKAASCFDVGGIGDVGYHCVPDNDEHGEGWEVYLYPAPTIVEGLEGISYPADLQLELVTIGTFMEEVEDILWRTTSDGSHVSICGRLQGAFLTVEFSSEPPEDAVPTKKVYKDGTVEDISG